MEENHKLARQWAIDLKDGVYGSYDDESSAAAEYILATTTPPTMADVYWDDEKHYLAGAEDACGDPCVMLSRGSVDQIWAIDTADKELFRLPAKNTTPNGKRYELVEVTDKPENPDEPDHPEVLETVEDYENAPEGTIMALPGGYPWVKQYGIWRSPIFRDSSESIALGWDEPFNVLRWGPGDGT